MVGKIKTLPTLPILPVYDGGQDKNFAHPTYTTYTNFMQKMVLYLFNVLIVNGSDTFCNSLFLNDFLFYQKFSTTDQLRSRIDEQCR